MKDFRGVEILVGARVAHAGRSGSSMWLDEAVVVEVGDDWVRLEKPSSDIVEDPTGRWVRVACTRRSKVQMSDYLAVLGR